MGGGHWKAPSPPSGGETSEIHTILEANNNRQMDTGGDRERLLPSVHLQTYTVKSSRNSTSEGSGETGTFGTGDPGPNGQGCCGDCHRWERLRGLLFPLFSGSQKGRLMEANTKPEGSKPPSEVRQVPHGDPNLHSPMHQSRGLDVQPGPERCLPACASDKSSPEVSPVCFQKSKWRTHSVSVEGPPIRAIDLSQSVHQADSPTSGAHSLQRTCNVSLSGRHVRKSSGTNAGTKGQEPVNASANVSRLHNKPEQICPDTNPGYDTSGGQDQVRSGTGHPSTIESRSVSPIGSRNVSTRTNDSPPVLEVYWANDSMHSNDPTLFVQDTSADNPSPGPLQARGGSTEQTDSNEIDRYEKGDFILTIKSNLEMGVPLGPLPPKIIISTDASLLGWGGCVSRPDLLGTMVIPGLDKSYKYSRNEGSLVDTATLRSRSAGSVNPDIDGQYHSDGLPQQRRRHSFKIAKHISQTNDQLVFGAIDTNSVRACAGSRQCSSRCIVAAMANGRQRHDSECRVVPGPKHSKPDISEMGQAVHRPVCHSSEQKTIKVLQPNTSSTGGENPVHVHALGQKSGVCVPTHCANTDVLTQNNERRSRSDSRASMVAEKGVVPHTAGNASRTSHSASRGSKSTTGSKGHKASRSRDSQVNRLEGLGQSLKTAGISKDAAETIEAAHRPSTRALYKRKWEVFRVWCDKQHVNPVHPPIRKVINYLQHLLSVHIKVATILTHISALSVCCDPIEGASIGCHPLVKTWVKGSKALNPRIRTLMPSWSLPVVLSALREQPYEPMAKADLKYVTLKTAFLIAITSARRISELQALCMAEPFLILNPASAFLRVNNAFLPKVASDLALNADIELQAFYPKPRTAMEKEQHKHCPIRALKYYLEATKEIRGENLNLFANTNKKSLGLPVSKRIISTWLAEVIRGAYFTMGHDDPMSIRANPHSLRGVATTFAELAAVSPKEICRAATWSSYCMFSQVYRLDNIAKGNFGTAVLETASKSKTKP